MRDFIRDYLPSVSTFSFFFSGFFAAMLATRWQYSIATVIFAVLPILYITLRVLTDRHSPRRVRPPHTQVPDIDLTW